MEKSIYSRDHTTFLHLLAETRANAGMTQVELAKRLDVAQATISKFERGDRRLDLLQLREICVQLEVSLVDFVTEFEQRVKQKGRRTRRRKKNPKIR